jgi:hypothetical protein
MLTGLKIDLTPRTGKLGDFGEFTLTRVETETQGQLWNLLVGTWHYLGTPRMIGPRIKYLIMLRPQPVGALSYQAGSLRLGGRDALIGWTAGERGELLGHCLNQNRFLILPWIRVKCLASHILSRSLRQVRTDWRERYGMEPYVCETFVDPSRYPGTCYRAAGWMCAGETGGYGRQGGAMVYHGNRKRVFLTFLDRGFLERFRSGRPAGGDDS